MTALAKGARLKSFADDFTILGARGFARQRENTSSSVQAFWASFSLEVPC